MVGHAVHGHCSKWTVTHLSIVTHLSLVTHFGESYHVPSISLAPVQLKNKDRSGRAQLERKKKSIGAGFEDDSDFLENISKLFF